MKCLRIFLQSLYFVLLNIKILIINKKLCFYPPKKHLYSPRFTDSVGYLLTKPEPPRNPSYINPLIDTVGGGSNTSIPDLQKARIA